MLTAVAAHGAVCLYCDGLFDFAFFYSVGRKYSGRSHLHICTELHTIVSVHCTYFFALITALGRDNIIRVLNLCPKIYLLVCSNIWNMMR